MRSDVAQWAYIKFLKWLIILSLLLPINAKAQEKIEYKNYNQESVLYRPSEEVIDRVQAEYEAAQAQLRLKAASHGSNYGGECVQFAKSYLHLSGTWGAGGSNLALNSPATVDAVVIFWGTHVAVVTAVTDTTITIIESNYDYHGHIRTRILDLTDPSIHGFHKF